MAGGPFSPVSMTLDGAALKAAFAKLGKLAGQEAAKAFLPEGRAILFGAKQRVAVRTGDLSNSGRFYIRVYPDAAVLKVTFGDKGIDYAVVEHQRPGGKSYKFLEASAKARAAGMEGRLGAALGAGIERAAT